MTVYEKNGRWYFSAMIRKKRYHRAISEAVTKKDAETYFNAFKIDLLRGKLDLVENIGSKPFKELCDEYINYTLTNNKSYKTTITKAERFKQLWGNRQLKDISPLDIEKYKNLRKKDIVTKEKVVRGIAIPAKTVSNTTINRDLEVLKKMFNIAIENNWINKNPCNPVKKLQEENHIERYLTPEEERRILDVCVDGFAYMKNIILLALNTGMRKGEILNLTWDTINLKENKITLLTTKNGKKRIIPINSVVKQILLEEEKNKFCKYVFANPLTLNRFSDLKRAFSSICKLAHVDNFRFHDLRHTAATRMVGAGVSITLVKDILGHQDITTTMRYAHAITEHSLDAMETLSNYSQKINN